jgi:hypothetical protein
MFSICMFFFIIIGYFLYLHFKCYPLSRFPLSQKPPSSSPLPLLLCGCSSTHPPTPTSPPLIPLHWRIYRAFIGPRTSSSIDDWQGHHLLHMQLEPCVLFGWWFSPWELWGVWLIDIVVLPVGLKTPSAPSVHSLNPPLGPCTQCNGWLWAANSVLVRLWQGLLGHSYIRHLSANIS